MPRVSLRYSRRDYEARVGEFLQLLGITPKQAHPLVYLTAFVHRSVLNESQEGYAESNERLEYLGDAVIELVITEALFYHFPEKPE